jgi:MATE family multidrug resistance protein
LEQLAFSYVILSLFFVSMGTLQAQARPNFIAASFLVGAWCVGVPLAYTFAHPVHMGIRGLWLGMVVGYAVTTFISGGAALCTDWDRVSRDVAARLALSVTTPRPAPEEGRSPGGSHHEEEMPLLGLAQSSPTPPSSP